MQDQPETVDLSLDRSCCRTLEDQLALEAEMFDIGRDRVLFMNNRYVTCRMESLSHYGTALTVAGVDKLIRQINYHCRRMEKGEAGRSYALLGPMAEMPARKVAAVAVRVVMDQITQTTRLHPLAHEVGQMLWMETMLHRATKWELKLHKRVPKRRRLKAQDITRMQNTQMWDARERLATGVFLVQLIATHTGLIEVYMERQGIKTVRMVRATDGCMQWIKGVTSTQELLSPLIMPMVYPAKTWTTPLDGGYYTPEVWGNTLIKTDSEIVAKETKGDEPFIRAANMQQQVAWQVNDWMLRQLHYAWDRSLEIGKLMPREGWEVPPYPKHLPDDHPDVTQWKFNARQIHEKNDNAKHRKVATAKQLWLAEKFAGERALYYPMQLDFRGRYYYRPPFLNPQANDIGRSLLQFAEGTPLRSKTEANWLKIHGANLYGHGKLTWNARLDWANDNAAAINAAGNDPWSYSDFWTKASDPWQFLAFCRAHYQWHQAVLKGDAYVCQLPVQLDCTCSGIQHYAAFLRNEGMASLVNLLPSEKPQDIYNALIDRVLDILRNDDNPDAAKWLSLQPDRTLGKNIVMTLPYSASRRAVFGFCQQWACERGTDLYGMDCWAFKRGAIGTCHYMATILYRETSDLIGPARDAMQWFKRVGRVAGENNIALHWHSPSGLYVRQTYENYRYTRIKLHHLSTVPMDLRSYHIPAGLDPMRMGNGLSPNVVHSMDASHMALATIRAMEGGVRNLGGIHDCFSTTPAEMETLRDAVRSSFADLYSHDWYTTITDELLAQIPEELRSTLPPRPMLGGLDVNHVRQADYFIS